MQNTQVSRQLSLEEKFAKTMTNDILKSLRASDNPMAILIESYIQKQLENYRDEMFAAIDGDPFEMDNRTYEEYEADTRLEKEECYE
jgi:hypothetical protein